MTNYLPVKPNNSKTTHLRVELSYRKGGYNYFTYKEEGRGYYLSVSPVERFQLDGVTMESYTAFTGTKILIKEVTRKSAKAEREALEMARAQGEELVKYVCEENNLELEEVTQ